MMRTAVRKEVHTATGVPSKTLTKRIRLRRANKRRQVGQLWFGTYNVKAIDMGAKALAKGRGVSHKGPGGRVKKPHAFIATMPSGRVGAFERVRKSRLPIKEVVVSVLPSAKRAINNNLPNLEKNFKRIYKKEFNFRLNKSIEKRQLTPR